MSSFPCSTCGASSTRVIDTRWKHGKIVRQHRCTECSAAFVTHELELNAEPCGSQALLALIPSRGLRQLGIRSGVPHQAIMMWKRGRRPLLPLLEAVLNSLGYELVARRVSATPMPSSPIDRPAGRMRRAPVSMAPTPRLPPRAQTPSPRGSLRSPGGSSIITKL